MSGSTLPDPVVSDWPVGGGACGALIRAHDWSATPLGPIANWSATLRTLVDTVVSSPVPQVLMWGPEHVMLYNDGYMEIAGDRHPAALGGRVPEVWPEIWDWNRDVLAAGFAGEIRSYRDQSLVLHRFGVPEQVTFDLYYAPVREASGPIAGVLCTVVDTTERVATQAALARSEAELRIVTDALPVLISFVDRDHVYRFANSFYEDWLGYSRDAVVGRHIRDVVGEDAYRLRMPWIERALAGEAVVEDTTMPHRDGTARASEVRYIPRRDADGRVDGFHVLVFDVEERVRRADVLEAEIAQRRRAEEQLRTLNETLEARVIAEIAERARAEAELAQAQKMETIGKLTGGVAHDFNNLLQVVSGNLQLLSRDVGDDPRARRRVDQAMAGVTRGAKLAAQLLAFGRRQALEPKVVNVTRFVRGMDDMLRRAIGEEIAVDTLVGEGLWNTFIDPAQIENALLNLAINARDAMGGSGRLTIELANATLNAADVRGETEVAAGDYVMLAVGDTGTGIAPEIIDQVFEPFFSTKREGKGSGLGLSMVYGFVKQSGGHVAIQSQLGVGTTIRLYLPRAVADEDADAPVDTTDIEGGGETILVVEDDAEVRATVVETLSELGYGVLEAEDADHALAVLERGAAIDLLFTDVVMPGTLKSPELARRARAMLPGVAVLFTSGYTDNAILGHAPAADVDLLPKPYARETLARRVRQVLARGHEAG